MKLSEIKGEEALDVLADIIDPATEIMADEEIQDSIEKKEPQILLMKKILKRHKKSILTILAILNREDPETYKPSLLALPKMVLELINDEELMSLFHSQGPLKEGESSVSASENIAE